MMRWKTFLPLRYIISRAAKSQGFLDPLELMARLRSLAQPSEVGEPIELLRAGMVFHARGLINSKVIQQNLDWVWPYWIERQYDPRDDSFLPRAFSATHVNLTHRNWTAIGLPDVDEIPIVDPRGLLTPFYDGWSIDAWLVTDDGERLLPSTAAESVQTLELEDSPTVVTVSSAPAMTLTTSARGEQGEHGPECRLKVAARSSLPGKLVVGLRPTNPEGISFLHRVTLDRARGTWRVEEKRDIVLSEMPARHCTSTYTDGDVMIDLERRADVDKGYCDVGLLTAACVYPLEGSGEKTLELRIPLAEADENMAPAAATGASWPSLKEQACRFECPESRYNFLYRAAVHSLILHSPHDVYPGPYTYKRFWFRDAAFILNALLCLGLTERVERAIHRFPKRQTALGFFRSQEGEWDSNGEVLWLLERFKDLTGRMPAGRWEPIIQKAASWITHKRLDDNLDELHAGLLPAGFSAEHLGPNDYYYWDNFWSLAGLRAALRLMGDGAERKRERYVEHARKLEAAVDRTLAHSAERLGRPAMPASPYRRLDAGAIGSLAVAYPLQLWSPDDPRLTDCVEFLLEACFVDDAFFQDMIHSGLNAYLTLHVAQALLRNEDPRYLTLMDRVAELATSTGQWPEAIHPRTMGGCMGDGHHVWASAEWVMMVRNCFVREEGDSLVIGAGVPRRWLTEKQATVFGPTPTPFGPVSVALQLSEDGDCQLTLDADWRDEAPVVDVRLPGFNPQRMEGNERTLTLQS